MQIIGIHLLKKKRMLRPLFFVFFLISFGFAQAAIAIDKKLYNDPQWLALLHIYKGSPDITDGDFFIGGKFVSSKDEFDKSVTSFFVQNDQKAKCRFPARFFWLAQKLNIQNADIGSCPDFELYQEKVPVDSISLLFGAEDISIPTSMMGHIFLRLSGLNEKGERIDHAISFYTNTKNIGFFELILKSFAFGMKGYYSLSSLQDYKNSYLYNEQRNVWEYTLALKPDQKELIKNHLYELRDIKFKYLFHFYNCATFIHSLLDTTYPELSSVRSAWVTPLDVVRGVYKEEKVESMTVFPASKWKMAAIQDSFDIDKKDIKEIRKQNYENIQTDSPATWELAKAYNHFLSEEGKIDRKRWEKDEALINARSGGVGLDLSQYKLPHKTQNDSQVVLATESRNGEQIHKIGYLPMSHTIADDNSQYISESELKIFDLHLAYNGHQRKFGVDELNLYSLAVYNPSFDLMGSFSWKFNMGYGPRFQIENNFDHVYFIEGALGKTYRVLKDVDLFGFLNVNSSQNERFNFDLGPEVGAIIREVGSMKTILSVGRDFKLVPEKSIDELGVTQAVNFGAHAVNVVYRMSLVGKRTNNNYSLVYKFLY